MKIFRFIFLSLAFIVFALEARAQETLKFKAKIGFVQGEDQIVEHQFLEGGKKLLVIGQTGDKKFIYSESLGSFSVYNFAEKRAFTIPLETYTDTTSNYDPNLPYQTESEPRNIEYVSFSPNGKFILKSGGDLVSVFDIETGKEIQTLFDREKVKYDKRNKIKKSGLGRAGWTDDGRFVFAFENDSGLFDKSRTVNFWEVVK